MIRRKAATRNLLFVFALFAVAGILIALGSAWAPYVPYEEPEELTQKRLDLQNNAYYALMEAVALLPVPPPGVEFVEDANGEQVKFKPEPDSLAALLMVYRPDDDPLLIEYIRNAKPAVEAARVAAQKPFCLFPPTNWDCPLAECELPNWTNAHRLHGLYGLLILAAAAHPCSADPEEDACALLQNVLRLLMNHSDRYYIGLFPAPFAVDIMRRASPEHQQAFAQLLNDLRDEWKPSPDRIEHPIRLLMQMKPEPDQQLHLTTAWWGISRKVKTRLDASRQKLFIRRNANLFRVASGLTLHQYEQQLNRFGILYEAPHTAHFNGNLHSGPIQINSRFFAVVDGLRIALALELHRRERGGYPETLQALMPDYLPTLPKSPYDGQDFGYSRQDADYELHFNELYVQYHKGVKRGHRVFIHRPPQEPAQLKAIEPPSAQ